MRNKLSGAIVITIGAALALHATVDAQRGGGAGPVRFPSQAQFEASAEAQKHVAAARKIAGADLAKEFENTCSATGPQRVALAREAAGLPPLKDYTVEPTKVFDNMWYVGLASQGAFVITTSEGIILIDTFNNTEEARDVIVPGIKKAGLDPAQIKYIVMTHGHPGQTDHTGGANYLQRTYRPRVMMSKEDWDATLPAQRPERPLATRDMDIVHGQKLTLGDTTLTFTTLFGHSAGSLGIFIPVKWRGQSARRLAARRRTAAPDPRLPGSPAERRQGICAQDERRGHFSTRTRESIRTRSRTWKRSGRIQTGRIRCSTVATGRRATGR